MFARRRHGRQLIANPDLDVFLESAAGRKKNPAYEVRWLNLCGFCLRPGLGFPGDDFRLEQSAAKNITSVACWRVVDRTMSLLAAEGLETARSKAASHPFAYIVGRIS